LPRSKTYDRKAALARAVRVFWHTGYSATSMRDLLQATGLASKSLYADFGSKDDLFLEVLDHYIALNTASYRASLGTAPFGLGRIRAHFDAYQYGPRFDGCLLVTSLAERPSLPAAAVDRIARFFESVRALYAENLRAAQQVGELDTAQDVIALAEALLVFDQGLAVAGKSPGQRRTLHAASGALLDAVQRKCPGRGGR
jgi:TetR/AcrR family transcriptional repressor of nem operon